MTLKLKGVLLEEGMVVQFDDDYFGHGMTRELYVNGDGVLGFESTPGSSNSFCYVKDWIKEIEIVTEDTVMRTKGKRVTLGGKRHFY